MKKNARFALAGHPVGPVDMPTPQKPKPSLHVELEDIEDAGTLAIGEEVTLTVTGKVTSMSEEEWGEEKMTHTSLTLRLSKIRRTGSSEPEDDVKDA